MIAEFARTLRPGAPALGAQREVTPNIRGIWDALIASAFSRSVIIALIYGLPYSIWLSLSDFAQPLRNRLKVPFKNFDPAELFSLCSCVLTFSID